MLNLEGILNHIDIHTVSECTTLRFKDKLRFKTPEAFILHEQGILPDDQIKALCEKVYGFTLEEPKESYVPEEIIGKFEGSNLVPVRYSPMSKKIVAVDLAEQRTLNVEIPNHTIDVKHTTIYYYFEHYQKCYGNPPPLLEVPVKVLFEGIVTSAINMDASEFTISNEGQSSIVYYRVRKRKVESKKIYPKEFSEEVIKLVTLRSPMDMSSRKAKDVDYDINKEYRGRVNIQPKLGGFLITVRLLPNKSFNTSLEDWNLTPTTIEWLRDVVLSDEPGLRIIVGETESGKNTTALSLLMEIAANRNKKIISIGMPIEQRLQGVEQVTVDSEEELADAVHALVRQNPDIVYITEIRDTIALPIIQVANTGKWVLTTLHANSVADTISRLVDISGLSQDRVIQSIHSICWQKLVRDEEKDKLYPIDRFVCFTDEVKYKLYGRPIGEVFKVISDIEEGDA